MKKHQSNTSNKINFSFVCNQDWNKMRPTVDGKYCSVCSENVKDYTRYSLEELQNIKGNNDSLCGQFAPHQIDPSLIKIDGKRTSKGFFSLSVLSFLGFNSAKAQTIEKPKVEQVDSTHNSKSCHSDIEEKSSSNKAFERAVRKRKRRRRAIESGFAIETIGRYSTYLSWRYPFIVRKSNIRGKFRF